jgi:site-specific recombinase XerD
MPDAADLIPLHHSDALTHYVAQAHSYAQASKAANTQRAYRADWASFSRFCLEHGQESLPAAPQTVALYATALASRLKANTITRHLSAISQAHQLGGFLSPTREGIVRTVIAGIRRVHGTAAQAKAPLSPDLLRRLLAQVPDDLRGRRDRALLLIGFAGAFRRSELVALTIPDVEFVTEGLVLTIPHSKTDPEGAGQTIGIPYGKDEVTCPVRALRKWFDCSGIKIGPIFRAVDRWTGVSDRALEDHRVAVIIKKLATKAGLEAVVFAGHSLRSGLATSAAEGGATERAIMEQTRHRSLKQLRRYVRRGSLFRDNPVASTSL